MGSMATFLQSSKEESQASVSKGRNWENCCYLRHEVNSNGLNTFSE